MSSRKALGPILKIFSIAHGGFEPQSSTEMFFFPLIQIDTSDYHKPDWLNNDEKILSANKRKNFIRSCCSLHTASYLRHFLLQTEVLISLVQWACSFCAQLSVYSAITTFPNATKQPTEFKMVYKVHKWTI